MPSIIGQVRRNAGSYCGYALACLDHKGTNITIAPLILYICLTRFHQGLHVKCLFAVCYKPSLCYFTLLEHQVKNFICSLALTRYVELFLKSSGKPRGNECLSRLERVNRLGSRRAPPHYMETDAVAVCP